MNLHIQEFLRSPLPGLKRSGIVPYTDKIHPKSRYYCLGIDYYFGHITEFAGKVDTLKDGDIIDTALREFHEETGGIFAPLTREDLISQNVEILHDDLSLLVFVRVDVDNLTDSVSRYARYIQPKIMAYEQWKLKTQKRKHLQKKVLSPEESALNPEISTLIWLSEVQLRTSLRENNVPPIRFYYPSGRLLIRKFSD